MNKPAIFVLNAGSSSLKFALFDMDSNCQALIRGNVSSLRTSPRLSLSDGAGGLAKRVDLGGGPLSGVAALQAILTELRALGLFDRIGAVGHRMVHGGSDLFAPTPLTEPILAKLRGFVPLAPLHQPACLEMVEKAIDLLPNVPNFGCFDTAFHRGRPKCATHYGLPRALTEYGVVSYGFHGLSYAYIAGKLRERFGAAAGGRTIVAHLGSGASLCAMNAGRSMATTMGFSTLDGLLMGTRCGTLDPGVILYLLQERGMTAAEISRLLYDESGLLGVSGVSGDMQALLSMDDPRAAEAVDLFIYRAVREIGSLVAALEGLDTLVFTAGVGENSPIIRERICRALGWLGVEVDPIRNLQNHVDIGRPGSAVDTLVIPTDEEKVVAEQLVPILAAQA